MQVQPHHTTLELLIRTHSRRSKDRHVATIDCCYISKKFKIDATEILCSGLVWTLLHREAVYYAALPQS